MTRIREEEEVAPSSGRMLTGIDGLCFVDSCVVVVDS